MTNPEETKECALCDRVLATVGLFIGIAFLYIAVDVFTNGWITTALTERTDDE